MPFYSETDKIRDKVQPYLHGFVIDVGSAGSPITPTAFCIDGRDFPNVSHKTDNLYTLPEQLHGKIQLADCLFSSHVLEHLPDHYGAIVSWSKLIKKGGYLVLYLPDGRYYDNKENQEHLTDTDYDKFLFWFSRTFCGEGKDFRGNNFTASFQIIESGLDIGEDRYSFYIVSQKL